MAFDEKTAAQILGDAAREVAAIVANAKGHTDPDARWVARHGAQEQAQRVIDAALAQVGAQLVALYEPLKSDN